MTILNSRLIPITDDRGKQLLPIDDRFEPNPGSVVLTQGNHGTAWQRFFADGKWYAVGRVMQGVTWNRLLLERNLVLVYDAEERA